MATQRLLNCRAPFEIVVASTTSAIRLHTSITPFQSTTTHECLFDIQVPEGRCVGLKLTDLPNNHPDALRDDRILETNNNYHGSDQQQHWIYNHLHADEVRYGLELSRPTQASFWIGRMALRHAMSSSSSSLSSFPCAAVSTRSILKDSHGRPQLPPGWLGSISHKGRTGVALVVPATVSASDGDGSVSSATTSTTNPNPPLFGIGVDIDVERLRVEENDIGGRDADGARDG